MAECAFDMILREWAEREWEELENAPEFETSERHDRAMERIFKRYERNTRKLRPRPDVRVRCTAKRVLIVVLAVFLALIAGCSATYFISRSFRSTVHPDCVEVFLFDDNGECPNAFENTYYLSALPEDYVMIQKNDTSFSRSCLYKNSRTGELIMFEYLDGSQVFYPIFLDTENGTLSEVEINGSYGLFLEDAEAPRKEINNIFRLFREDGNINSFIWDKGDYIFEIYSDLPKNDIINLAKSAKVL